MDNEKQLPEFYNTLAECVDSVLRGERTVDECLATYPEYANLLKTDLQIAVLTYRLRSPRMSPDRVAALEIRLREQMARKRAVIPFVHWAVPTFSRTGAAILLAVVLFFGGGGGLVAASADSNPGDDLYTIKRAWEQVVIVFHSVTGIPEDLWLRLAETRLDEVVALVERNRLTDDALRELYEATNRLLQKTNPEAMTEVGPFLLRTQETLTTVMVVSGEGEAITQQIRGILDPAIQALEESSRLPQPTSSGTPSPAEPIKTTPTWASTEMTVVPTMTVSPASPRTVTPIATTTFPAAETGTAIPTRTPRFAPTSTRTSSPTPTQTLSPTPTATSSPTWTPLPSPTPGGYGLPPVSVPTQPPPSPVPGITITHPSPTWYPWVQATFDAEYLTQTAEADSHATQTAEAANP